MAPPKKSYRANRNANEYEVSRKEFHCPGIVGAGSLVAGIALFVTARRKDEPESEIQSEVTTPTYYFLLARCFHKEPRERQRQRTKQRATPKAPTVAWPEW